MDEAVSAKPLVPLQWPAVQPDGTVRALCISVGLPEVINHLLQAMRATNVLPRRIWAAN